MPSFIDYQVVAAARAAVALAGALTLAWLAVSSRRGRPSSRRWGDILLAATGVAAAFCWLNLGRLHYDGFLALHDQYHYYVGAKYFRELGYTGLYECATVADVEAGLQADVSRRWMRNLVTNDLEIATDIVRDPSICTRRFTPARWQAFTADVAWFREHLSHQQWQDTYGDHGFNAPPAWAVAGGLLARAAPASSASISALALIDPLLWLGMFGSVWWAFGWRVMCVALIWWGTNYPAQFHWLGGTFLRSDWLFLTVLGICFMKRGHPLASGFTLMYATLIRIFPAFIIAGLVLKAGMTIWRTRTVAVAREHLAFAGGCAIAVVVVISASALTLTGGVKEEIQAWSGFAANSRKHMSTPMANNMGLRVVASYEPQSRMALLNGFRVEQPWDTWTAARHRVFSQRAPLFWGFVVGFVLLVAVAVSRQDDWVALVLGATLIPISSELACYYYGFMLVFGFLWTRWPWSGVALCALSAFSTLTIVGLDQMDDIYFAVSVGVIVYCIAVAGRAAAASLRHDASLDPVVVAEDAGKLAPTS